MLRARPPEGRDLPFLNRHHRCVAAVEDQLRGGEAEVPRVLHVEGNRVGAAQLVADLLVGDRSLDPEALEASLHLSLEDVAEVELSDPDVPVRVALHRLEVLELVRVEALDETLGDHGHSVVRP